MGILQYGEYHARANSTNSCDARYNRVYCTESSSTGLLRVADAVILIFFAIFHRPNPQQSLYTFDVHQTSARVAPRVNASREVVFIRSAASDK